MAIFDYVDIPACATLVPPEVKNRLDAEVHTSLPPASKTTDDPALPSSQGSTPTRNVFGNLPGLLLASSLQIPANASSEHPRRVPHLLSTRDPLSVPTTTLNFRRFISRIGPVFWLQDRIEEIVTWRKGWKVTMMWMVAYSFLCYFPRLILLLPNIIALTIIIVAHPPSKSSESELSLTEQIRPPTRAHAREGSAEWLGNIQGIQNLMGLIADVHDAVVPYVHHLTFATPYTPFIFTIILLSTLLALPLLYLVPLRPLLLVGGLTPFAFSHPLVRDAPLARLLEALPLPRWRARLTRLIDDDRLKDHHFQSELREVELFENERLAPGGEGVGWSKANLKMGERVAWTRGRDGCSAVTVDGGGGSDVVSSNLTFLLEPGWAFVETEDWRADIEAKWCEVGADNSGWVYTNDAWLEPHALPKGEGKAQITRRRRWVRRIYLNPAVSATS
ncbi:integral peroxisomal membrane peroxin-domain-containing protein [Russula earlei]|uniref:Integral peroxisomal membrane peroxin-domain-containing protein n=1 Tax=Russula earlei TaxID=71964 RepID=A0ACC0UB82_9AGAM|nr:integral peroxisomal membrane peroxin-domain-containing protein [Russula earlei]